MKDTSKERITINSMADIKKLKDKKNIKYINLNIENPNLEVIYYLIDKGENYSYSEKTETKEGYIYVPHEIFKQSELFILDIISNIPTNLTKLEIARFLYITIAKNIGYDINILPEKNETFNLSMINTINNIWGSIYNQKATNKSYTNLFLYLCRRMNIDCNIITMSKLGYQKNILTINNQRIITDLTQDVPYIQGSFKTKYFNGYNDNQELDTKIGYIQNQYSETLIDNALKQLDYTKDNIIEQILITTQNIINASFIKPIELSIIYELIFNKYCPSHDITIHNLYIKDEKNNKEHFIIINYQTKYYSYNYSLKSFVEVSSEELTNNIENNKIGLYLNEKLPILGT